MGIRDWLAIIVIICLVLVILDGFRRAWLDRKNRIVMKLDKSIPQTGGEDDDVLLKSELPNGGARTKVRGDVPVLMESVDLNDEDIEDFVDDEYSREPYSESLDDDSHDEWHDDLHDDLHDKQWDETDYPEDELADDADEEDEYGDEAAWEDESSVSGQGTYGEEVEDDFGNDEFDTDTEESDPWAMTTTELDESDHEAKEDPQPVARAEEAPRRSSLRKAFFKGRESSDDRIEPSFGEDDPVLTQAAEKEPQEMPLENHDLFDVRADEEMEDDDSVDAEPMHTEVIVINVMARPGTELEGGRMLQSLLKQGMRLGEMSIFHRHADRDGKGPVMFSMANIIKPGTFSMSDMDNFSTPGVSFFMQMPNKLGNMSCFEQMLSTAEAIRTELDAQLKDENRSVFTRQTIEHCRQRVRDFELEMLARK